MIGSTAMKLVAAICLGLFATCGNKPPITTPPVVSARANILVNVDEHGVALQGHDAVAYRDGAPVAGSVDHSSNHAGATYWFASAEHKTTFDAEPAKYAPRYGGYCAYAASQNRLSPVQIDQFEIYEDHLLMFTNADFKQRFDAAPAASFKAAEAYWPDLVAKHGTPQQP